jgi:putative FmdB family regulatory protein
MPIYEYICDNCGQEQHDVLLPVIHEPAKCPKCGAICRQRFGSFSVRGFFRWMNDGKADVIVSYPGGHTRTKTHNELYRDGGL